MVFLQEEASLAESWSFGRNCWLRLAEICLISEDFFAKPSSQPKECILPEAAPNGNFGVSAHTVAVGDTGYILDPSQNSNRI